MAVKKAKKAASTTHTRSAVQKTAAKNTAAKKTAAPKKPEQLSVCQITFPFTIKPAELAGFRGAVLDVVKKNKKKFEAAGIATNLFHNHDEEAPGRRIIRPPAVVYQFSHSGGRGEYQFPAVTGFGRGAAAVQALAGCMPPMLTIYQRTFGTTGCGVQQWHYPTAPQPEMMEYALQRWLALNPDNYTRYKKCVRFADRVLLLEEVLRKNLLGWYREMGITLAEKKLNVCITEITAISHNGAELNGRNMFVFSGHFAANWPLPEQMAIGNGTARGFGRIKPLHRTLLFDKTDQPGPG